MKTNSIAGHLGNLSLLALKKKAFLCSRKIPASVILKCYDWAIQQREEGNCVISGFHSQIEKDVFHYLLKGNQAIILVLARGLKLNIEPEFVKAIEEGRLLIITPFEKQIKRVSEKTANYRNEMMITLADEIVVGFVSEGGGLEKIVSLIKDSKSLLIL